MDKWNELRNKWVIFVLIATIFLVACTYADTMPPPEFDPRLEGDGYRVLLIDDFGDTIPGDHGNKTTWILYDQLPMLDITQLDFEDANGFQWTDDYDLIICMMYFETEKQVRKYIPDRVLNANTQKISPAGNSTKLYKVNNATGKWFVTVGANGHDDWQQGEFQWNEDETFGGTCGATAMFGCALIEQKIRRDMDEAKATDN